MKSILLVPVTLLLLLGLLLTASDARTLTVGVYENRPMVFLDSGGRPNGFYIDLIEHIASRKGWDISYRAGKRSECLEWLKGGRVDIVPGVGLEPSEGGFTLTRTSVLSDWGQIYNRTAIEIESIGDLDGRTLAVAKDDRMYKDFRALAGRSGVDCHFVEVDGYDDALRIMTEGVVDACLVPRLYSPGIADLPVRRSSLVLSPVELRFGVGDNAGHDCAVALDAAIREMRSLPGSAYYKAQNVWFGDLSVRGQTGWRSWISVAAGSFLVALLIAGVLHLSRLRKKTRALRNEVEDRRRAEEALRKTEERFHALYNKMNEGVCLQEVLFDETGRAVDYMVLDVNPSYESILGLPVDIVVGKRGSELFNTEDPPFLSIYADVAVTERHTTFDSYYPPARRHFRVSAFSPQTGKVAAIFSDITESKERMDELKTSEGKFRILFENAPDAMYLNDLSGVFIEGNAQVERLTGYRIRELIGESLLKVGLLPIEQTLKAANNISLSAQGRATGPDEFTLIRKDGTHVQAEISTHPVKVDGQTLALSIARDITERKQKEAAVRESEERFRMVYESMGCGVIISDLNGNIQQVNHPVVNMLGYVNKEEMTGIHASLFIAEEDRRAASEDMMTALQTSERLTKEFQLVKRGGDVVNCEVDLDLLRAKDGSAAGFVILVRDVTDRRKDRQVMLDDVDTYKSLLEGLEEAVFRVGLPLGKYDYVSPAVKRVFGYASEEFLKNPLLMRKIVHPDFGRYFNEMWKDLIQGHIQPSYEYKVMDRDGTERWVFQSNRRVFNQSGKVTAIEGVWRDITEQKQADDTLRENEEQFRTMFELSSTAIEFYDSAYRLVHANRACLELFGVEDVGDLRKYNLITDHRTPEGVRRKLKENLSAEWETSLDLAETPGEGPHERSPRLVHLEVVVSPVEMGKGSPEWYLAEIRDIGKRKEHEKRRGQFEGLESATRIARAVARELNNVLTGVMGYSEHLAGELADNESLRSEAEEIKKAAEGVMARSRQLLRFSRSLPLKSEPLDLNSVISGAEGRIAHLLGEDKTLRINLKPSLDEVRADAEQIETILLNLASNAKDAMRSGDTLAIATDMVDIDSVPQDAPDGARPGHFVRLTVSDSGSGMDEETKCHILEPFFTTRGTSAGMGLSVVYGSIRQHGGWIDISSEPGAGTVCSVYLPAEKTAVRKEAAGVGSLDGGGERILLVEDDEIVRVMAAKVLRDKGYVVFPAADAGEAKSVFDSENHEFHLVFCDIVLPDRNGMELCDELVSARPGLKVLLTSGYTDRQTQLDSIGGRDFPLLEKPYALFDLLSALKETLAAGSGAGIL